MVIMYADKMTKSMAQTIDETSRRRSMQIAYNEQNGLVPTALKKSKSQIMESTTVATTDLDQQKFIKDQAYDALMVAEPEFEYQTVAQLQDKIKKLRKQMEKAAKDLDFMEAARIRDEIIRLEKSSSAS
jgi:excinuclease ABC subunit B